MSRKLISIVSPVYRNAESLIILTNQINDIFDSQLNAKYDYEIIYINDGSDDGSLDELYRIRILNKHVKIVNFTRNFGQAAALLAGHNHARGDAVITISADLQDPVSLMPKMINYFEGGSDVVICYRDGRDDGISRKFFSRITYSILRLSNINIPLGGFDYYLLSKRAQNTLNSHGQNTSRFFCGDILWPGYSCSMIPYFREKRPFGKSQYTFWKKIKSFLDMTLDASYLPIRFITSIGIFTSVLGLLYAFSIVVSWIFNLSKRPFDGWAPIIVSILVVGGLNMIMMGIVGEYIWRIYDQLKKRPPYVIDNITE